METKHKKQRSGLAKFKRLFKETNFTTQIQVQISGIKEGEFKQVLTDNSIDVSFDTTRGLITLWSKSNMLTSKEIQSLI